MFAKIVKIFALGPVVGIIVEKAEKLAVFFPPVSDFRFHGGRLLSDSGGLFNGEDLAGVGDGALDGGGGDHDG